MSLKHGFRVFLFIVVLAAVTEINGQASRTWVSGVGDDVNPCSRTAPCKTFAGAISKTADKGEINCLDSGGFGSVTITKSITLDCSGTQGSILAALTNGITVNNATAVVRVRGLNINGVSTGLNGIRVLTASAVSIENSVIDGFTQSGVAVAAVSGAVTVINTSIRNSGTGISPSTGTTVRISGNSIYGNTTGLGNQGSIVSLKNNMVTGNRTDGVPTLTVPLQ
jgi:hypothetical protein